jgi:hypothetical protein
MFRHSLVCHTLNTTLPIFLTNLQTEIEESLPKTIIFFVWRARSWYYHRSALWKGHVAPLIAMWTPLLASYPTSNCLSMGCPCPPEVSSMDVTLARRWLLGRPRPPFLPLVGLRPPWAWMLAGLGPLKLSRATAPPPPWQRQRGQWAWARPCWIAGRLGN